MAKVFLSWETPEFIPKEHTSDWYWAVGIISTAIVVTAILLNNVLLGIFIVIATVTIFMYAAKKPELIRIEISDSGIRVGRDMYPYPLLKAFWIIDNGLYTELLLRSDSILNPIISIPIFRASVEKIREFLGSQIVEEEIQEPLSQKLMEYLGF